jgi:hypothetical protein
MRVEATTAEKNTTQNSYIEKKKMELAAPEGMNNSCARDQENAEEEQREKKAINFNFEF